MVPSSDAVQNQDSLRILRAFVGAVAGYTSDQSYAGDDNGITNPAGQFVVLGPQGVVTEGKPALYTTSAAGAGGLVLPGWLLLVGVGVVAALVLKG